MNKVLYFIIPLVLVLALFFVGVFGFTYSYNRSQRDLQFRGYTVYNVNLENGDVTSNYTLRTKFFKTNDNLPYYDRVIIYYKLYDIYTTRDVYNFSTYYDLNVVGVVYNISAFRISNYVEYFFSDFNTLNLDSRFFHSAYMIPYALIDNQETQANLDNFQIDYFIKNNKTVPFYEVDSFDGSIQVYAIENNINLQYRITDTDAIVNLSLDTSLYNYFRGLVGSFATIANAFDFPTFDYAINNFDDLIGVFGYIFEYLGKIGDLMRSVVGTLLYGFVPTYFYLGG